MSLFSIALVASSLIFTQVSVDSSSSMPPQAAKRSIPSTYAELTQRNASLPDGILLQRRLSEPTPLLWLFLGDSITQGAAHTQGARCYVNHLEEMIRWERFRPRRLHDCVINAGVSGDTLGGYFQKKSQRILPEKADIVFINYGVNDVRSAITQDYYEQQLCRLISETRAAGAIPILQVPSPVQGMKQRDAQFRAAVRTLAQELNCLLIDHPLYWQEQGGAADGSRPTWMDDRLHPNAVGQLAMARAIALALRLDPPGSLTMGLPLEK